MYFSKVGIKHLNLQYNQCSKIIMLEIGSWTNCYLKKFPAITNNSTIIFSINFQIVCVSLMAVVAARPQITDYSDITDENDPRFMFDVSMK